MDATALPVAVRPAAGPWPLHDVAASRAAERALLRASAPHALMERAGLAVARLALALAPHARRIVVWAGPGNNGGDGLVAARHLHAAGQRVEVMLVGEADRRPADAANALAQARAAGVRLHEGPPDVAMQADLVIDALLGLGVTRAPQGAIADAIDRIGAQAAPVLAVDLPSGLHADTGSVLGSRAVRASATLSLLTLKPGLFTAEGRDHAGAVWLDALGVAAGGATALLSGPPSPPARPHASHKGRFGDLFVVGGAPGMAGAAWLAARAALAAGAGRVYASLLDPAAPFDFGRPELMMRPALWQAAPATLAGATVVCGCGGGDAVRETLPPLLAHAGRLVLDADALNAIAADAALLPLLRARAARGRPTLLTPHPLEAARLLGCSAAEVQRDRPASARQLAADTRCAVLLKGSGSVIAAADGRWWINPTGNAALASPGSGDVLAGWAGGLWAQQPASAPEDIATAAAWVHGAAADDWAAAHPVQAMPAAELIGAMRWG
ncbi:MAG: NAD(P)H-hydrate dehydratase [Rubrivivax sp.]|nr:NAD(P)H-hydrate dehydratase [Rubrivivax sp.]